MRSRIPGIIIIVALIILIFIIIYGSVNRFHQIGRTLPAVLKNELQAYLNRQVELKSIQMIYPNKVIINELKIADGKDFSKGVLLTSKKAIIRFNALNLLSGHTPPIQSISSITIQKPALTLKRASDGIINIDDLLHKPPSTPEKRFTGTVIIKSGKLIFIDNAAQTQNTPAVNTLEDINGSLQFSQNVPLLIGLAGKGVNNRIGNVNINGYWGSTAETTRLQLSIRDAAAEYWMDYISNIKSWSISKGIFNAEIIIYRHSDKKITARGSISIRRSEFTSSKYLAAPITPFAANVRFIGTNISINAMGYLKQSLVSATGHIYGVGPSRLDLRLTSDKMNLSSLQAYIRSIPASPHIRWTSLASVSASITGLVSNLIVDASMSAPRAVIYGTQVTQIYSTGVYRNGRINITQAMGYTGKGTINLSGTIDTRPMKFYVSGRATGVNLNAISMLAGIQSAGTANARFTLSYFNGLRSGNINAVISNGRISGFSFNRGKADIIITGPNSARGKITITRGMVSQAPIQSAVLNADLAGNRIQIRNLMANAFGGIISAQGTVLSGKLDIGIAANSINIEKMLQIFGYKELTGTANLQGKITGTLQRPVLTGRIAARDGFFRGSRYILLTGRLVASTQRLILEDVMIRLPGTTIRSIGSITIAQGMTPSIQTQIQSNQVDIGELLRFIGISINASGTAQADLHVSGNIENLQVSGTVSAQNAVFEGIKFDDARIQLASKNKKIIINQLYARREEMTVSGSGVIEQNGNMQISLTGQNLRLSLLNPILNPYLVLKGPMTFNGEIAGTLKQPSIRGGISSTAPVINNQPYNHMTAGMVWNNNILTMNDMSLSYGNVTYNLPIVVYNRSASTVRINGTIKSGSIERITGILHNSPVIGTSQGQTLRKFLATLPAPFTGSLDASINLAGPIGDISGTITTTMNNMQMGTVNIDSAELDIVAQQSAFYLEKAVINAPGINFTASAEFQNAQPIRLTSNLTNTELSSLINLLLNAPALGMYDFGKNLLSAVKSIPQPSAGVLNAEISLHNLQTAPTGTLQIRGRNLSLEGTQYGTLTADARLQNGSVFIDQFMLAPETGTAVVQGTINPDGLLSLTGNLTSISATLARPWLKMEQLSGIIDLKFTIQGPIGNPALTATLNAENLQTDLFSADSISVSNLTITGNRLASDNIVVNTNGSQLVASGSIPFAWTSPFIPRDQPLMVKAALSDQDLSLVESVTKYVKSASGALNANLELTGTLDNPVTSGQISLEKGFLDLRNFQNDFTNLTLNASFNDSSLLINEFNGASSQGGTFDIGGNISFGDITTGIVSLFITLNDLKLEARNITESINEHIAVTLSGQMIVTENIKSPVIQGQLVASRGRIQVPARPLPTTVQPPMLPINPQLSTTINLAQDVVIERGTLRATILGPITLGGSLNRPVVAGTVQLVDGKISYLNRSLIFQPGGTASFLFNPPLPATLTVDLTATTRVTTYSQIGNRYTRYTITLDISGPIGNLDVSVRSNPPGLSDLQALTSIFQGTALNAFIENRSFNEVFGEQLGQVLLGIALPQLFEPINLGGVILSIEPGYDIPIQLTATVPLSDKFSLSYSRSVVGRLPIDLLSINYTLSRQLQLTIQFEGQNGANRETQFLFSYYTKF